jgi:hypothetical protein
MGFTRTRLVAEAGVVAVVGGVLAAVVAGVAGTGATAKPLSRGSAVVLPDRPADPDKPKMLARWNGVRKQVTAPALTGSTCLDDLAQRYADTLAADPAAVSLPAATPTAVCAPAAKLGWVSGSDPTGVQQAQAALTRTGSGPSPLLDGKAQHLGVAVVGAG